MLKKQNLYGAAVLLLLSFLLTHPAQSLPAAKEGMKLWLETLLPVLLPFLILTGFLIHTDLISFLLKPLKPIFRLVFGLSVNGGYVLLLGLLCGYPMGAKLSADLCKCQKLSKREAEYLLTFSNNASPAFLMGYVAQSCLRSQASLACMFGILCSADFLCMLFFRFCIYKGKTATVQDSLNGCRRPAKKETSNAAPAGAVMDVSIMNGFETMTRLGGYLLLFSILSACVDHYWPFGAEGKYLIPGILELTTGLHALSGLPLSANCHFLKLPGIKLQFLLAMTMTAFGGLCIMAQTKSVISKTLSLRPYIFAKCLNAAATAALVVFFVF